MATGWVEQRSRVFGTEGSPGVGAKTPAEGCRGENGRQKQFRLDRRKYIGSKLNDRRAVLELYEIITRLRQEVDLDLVWVPKGENLAGRYIEKMVGL